MSNINNNKELLDKFIKLYYLLNKSPIQLLSDKLFIIEENKRFELIVDLENPEYVTLIYKRYNEIYDGATLNNQEFKNIINLLNQANELSIKYDNEKDFQTYKNSKINQSLGFELKLKLTDIKETVDNIYGNNQILANEKFLINPVNLMLNIFRIRSEYQRICLKDSKFLKFYLRIKNTEDIKNKLNKIGFDNYQLPDNPNDEIKIYDNLDKIFKNNNVIKKLYIIDFILDIIKIKNYFQPNKYFQNCSYNSYLKDIEIYNLLENSKVYQQYEEKLKELNLIPKEQSQKRQEIIEQLKIIADNIKTIDQNNSFIKYFSIYTNIDKKFKDNIEYIKNKIIDQKTNEKNLIEEFFDIFQNLDDNFDKKLDTLYNSYIYKNVVNGIFGNHLIELFESLNNLDENKIDEIANKIKSIETQIEKIMNEINNGVNPSTKVSELNLSPNLEVAK